MARCFVLDTSKNETRIAWCEELDDFYRELNCECFDIAVRKVGGKAFDIFCDDIGLFKDDAVVSAVSKSGWPMLVGNLVLANHDSEGNTTSLTVEDVKTIMNNIVVLGGDASVNGRLALLCEY